jgi:hypothetical protein
VNHPQRIYTEIAPILKKNRKKRASGCADCRGIE